MGARRKCPDMVGGRTGSACWSAGTPMRGDRGGRRGRPGPRLLKGWARCGALRPSSSSRPFPQRRAGGGAGGPGRPSPPRRCLTLRAGPRATGDPASTAPASPGRPLHPAEASPGSRRQWVNLRSSYELGHERKRKKAIGQMFPHQWEG